MVDRPTFLIVGAGRSGTTSLHHHLGQHPDICMSRPKEPHFFDVDFERGIAHYWRTAFAHWQGQAHAGESTPSYIWYPEAAARIAESLPEARIVMLLRDPVDRAYSSWALHRSLGREERSFAAAIGLRADGRLERALEDPATIRRFHEDRVSRKRYDRAYQSFLYLEPGRYSAHLQRYWEHCGPGRVKAILFEDLERDAARVVRDLLGYLGADASVSLPDLARRNARLGPGQALLRRRGWGRSLRRWSGLVPSPARRLARRALHRLWPSEALDPSVRRAVQDYYRPYNRELARMLEHELAAWGT